MDAREALKQTLRTTNMVVSSYLSDLSDADLLVRPGKGCNHIAWQLGHLIHSNASILDAIAPGSAPALPAGFGEQHSKDKAGSPKIWINQALSLGATCFLASGTWWSSSRPIR
ncbi:MAG: DinB family protein [Pirellula sp.]|nr:DinB family protein [Pirellula sp.]